jgi:drug/metabolite transporter (DMT)-like permease
MMVAAGIPQAMAAVVFWSTNALAARYALAELTVAQTLLCQFAGAFVSLGAIALIDRGARPQWRESVRPRWIAVGTIGVVGTVTLQYAAFASAPIVEANILSYGWPVLVALWGILVYRDGGRLLAAGLTALAFLGTIVLLGGIDRAPAAATTGHLLALGASLCMAFYSVATRRCQQPLAVLLPAVLVGLLGTLAVTLIESRPVTSTAGVLGALYIGLVPMGLGYLLWTRAMRAGDPARLAVLGYMTPLLSTGLLLAFGESLTVAALVGGCIILAANLGVLLEPVRRARAHAHAPARGSRQAKAWL